MNETLEQCMLDVANLTTKYDNLNSDYSSCCKNPCLIKPFHVYDEGLHIAAIFIILVAASIGTLIPILSKQVPRIALSDFNISLGKHAGTGVVLACGFIHMLQPGAQSLTSSCVPYQFNTVYNAYPYLFAMLAGLAMFFLEFILRLYVQSVYEKNVHSTNLNASPNLSQDNSPNLNGNLNGNANGSFAATELSNLESNGRVSNTGNGGHISELNDHAADDQFAKNISSHSGHSHIGLVEYYGDQLKTQKLVEAYLIEFGVTVHSVIIGLTVGITDRGTLKALLVALVFHQLLEGVALGARLIEANISVWNEIGLATTFAIASPIGIAIGLGVKHSFNDNGQMFLLTQGTLDSICGGILIYIGYSLLLIDFPHDIAKHCKGSRKHQQQVMFFLFLFAGAGIMAFIGKYL